MLLDPERFRTRLMGYARSAWRFECQPTYAMPNEQESLSRFLAGGTKPEGHNATWHATVRDLVASGRTIGRVRAVRHPLTNYQRYQLEWGIPGNIAAGEDIRIADVADLGLPRQDFWLFDDTVVVDLNFRRDGTLINVVQRDDADLMRYLQWRDVALAHAVPLSEWNART